MNATVPLIPETAPFSPEQRAWLNGFFAGLFSRSVPPDAKAQTRDPSPAALTPLTILFGSQTGTAEGLAKRAAKAAGQRRFAATVLDMAQTDAARLAQEKNVLVIVSTYGDGEPPDSAQALHTELSTLNSQLSTLRYSVCALGDTNYTQFCKCGADFDAFLEKRGAVRVHPRVDCDLDYETKFTAWLDAALSALTPTPNSEPQTPNSAASAAPEPKTQTPEPKSAASGAGVPSRSNPFAAPLLVSRPLNGAGSAKQVNHVEFDLADSGLVYEAGDALGVFPHNCPQLVADVLAALGADGEEAVPDPDGASIPLRRALAEFYDLGKPTAELLALCGSTDATAAPLHVIDAVLQSAVRNPQSAIISPASFVAALRKLQPRLYSISSSPRAHAGRVHLTVGAVRYEAAGRARIGVCSTYLAERAVPGATRVAIFAHSNRAFRPPTDNTAPMIMIGPGTGIAPFRAFLHERRAVGATGKNWLFFGDQRAATDFLYRDELLEFQSAGLLTRLDTAFSRDQAEKIYVQHRMLENAAELYAWLEAGAHVYVCGDATRMAKDVDAALHTVVERAGGKSPEQTAAYLQSLKAAKRYARDVY